MDTSYRKQFFTYIAVWLTFCFIAPIAAAADKSAAKSTKTTPQKAFAIATAHPLATQAGADILSKQGGNAFDAAVAISAALGVVEPSSSGFGGGGFWLLYIAKDNRYVMIDGREKAPLAASRDMYLDENGQPDKKLSKDGPLAAGIPGMPAALSHLANQYGELPLSTSLQPAILYAEQGFPMDGHLWQRLIFRQAAFNQATREVFFSNGVPIALDATVVQTDLAATLKRLATSNGTDFYTGKTAADLVAGVQAAGGIWTADDLAQYQVVERQPIIGHYRDFKIVSAAPPSSGGIVILQTLNILENLPTNNASNPAGNRTQAIHFYTEALRRSYRDRAAYLGDSDFVDMPLDILGHDFYAAGLAATIQPKQATPSASLPAVTAEISQGTDTTHFSVVDAAGNRVSATLSINLPFGSGFTVPGTGVLLNDEMDDFSIKPGVPNAYGLVGNEANAIEPGKRMLSSMSPTFVEASNGDYAVLGTPGGSRIITMVLQGILAFTEGQSAKTMVSLPRIHHQYLPDVISYESDAITAAEKAELTDYGHNLQPRSRPFGNMQAIVYRHNAKPNNRLSAASDPRGIGSAIVANDASRTDDN